MTFQAFQSANNARGQLLAGISTLATTLTLKSGEGGRFPTHNGTTDKDYPITLKKYASGNSGDWTKQEIVLVTKRVGDILTITRAWEASPLSSTSNNQDQTALSFDTDDYIENTFTSNVLKDLQDEIVLKANDVDVVHNTGDEAVAGIKTLSSSPVVPTPTTDYQASTKKYVDDQLLSNVIKNMQNEDLYVGEDIDTRESIFSEEGPTFAESTGEQNIGDVNANKNVSAPVFGSGNYASKTNLSLLKVGTPTVDLGIRIETDNAGDPSGALVDINAVGTILASALTTSLSSIMASIGESIDQINSVVYDASGSITHKTGYKISIDKETKINTITKDSSCTATTCYLMESDGTILDTQTFSGNIATFNYFVDVDDYYIMVDSGGGAYTSESKNNITFPIDNDICNYEGGVAFSNVTDIGISSISGMLSDLGDYAGIVIIPNSDVYVKSLVMAGNYTNCKLTDSSGTTIATASISGDIATFDTPQLLESGVTYRLLVKNGSDRVAGTTSGVSYPMAGTNVDIVAGRDEANGTKTDRYWSIESVTTGESQNSDYTEDTNGYNIEKINVVDPISLTYGIKHHLVLFQGIYGSETVSASNYYKIGYSTNNTTTRGLKLFDTSWSIVDTDKFIYNSSGLFLANLLSKTDASYSYKLPAFPMIAKESVVIGNKITYDFDGIVTGFTGLTAGEYYFVSDTVGEISSTPGTNSFMIGMAISDTEILLRNDARKSIGTSAGSATVTIGFYPRIVLVAVVGGGNAVFDESDISNKTATGFDINGAFDWVALG